MGTPNFSNKVKRDAVTQIAGHGYPAAEVSRRFRKPSSSQEVDWALTRQGAIFPKKVLTRQLDTGSFSVNNRFERGRGHEQYNSLSCAFGPI